MRAVGENETRLVVAARAGDARALDELVTAYLPLVYTIVRRGLDGRPDVDDVVQDVMVRALRRLPSLREPESFRLWLVSIAVRRVGTHLERSARAAERTIPLDDAADVADAAFETGAMARAELFAQRRTARRAGRWLDPDDRVLLALWWLESAREMSRAELAAALGVSVAHAGVRIQRMRERFEVSRAVVRALEARPPCRRLAAVLERWDGVPAPLWRKRAARHVRGCAVCGAAARGLLPVDHLLPALVLLPVPAGLAAAVLAKATLGKAAAGTALVAGTAATGAGAGSVAAGGAGPVAVGAAGALAQAIAAHPIVAAVTAAALATGVTVGAVEVAAPPPVTAPVLTLPGAPDATGAAPFGTAPPGTVAPGVVRPGPVSLESANAPGTFVAVARSVGVLAAAGPASAGTVRAQATFEVLDGLADPACVTFRFSDGRYLRHSSWRLVLHIRDRTELFRGDATFCARPGAGPGTVALESKNYPGYFLRHRGDELWVDQGDGTDAFRADSSFLVRAPLAR
ncbi:sigma-70 family RNA polymerase sigma factor [Catenuloplanes indicus]|uniref:RNA polymerase sigma factor (Sigma-70 family) n=1 Tax=Catenuloplanes indicus TaxID=137267 RepID=A0AAE4AXS6_9ACTN|nr:sigma-70 family RNA polymerase sigma factor [Catenuloplanes indicus]MDQ0364323.1 RNA polymerase sigma factor (sigma-70 family) [Catenuloplanes indicus]